jgi:hypothetical protein
VFALSNGRKKDDAAEQGKESQASIHGTGFGHGA